MYLEMAAEDDKKMTESWKADADGILIFVGTVPVLYCFSTDLIVIDWFILCGRRHIYFGVYPGCSPKFAGHNRILPCKHLSGSS